MPVTLSFSAPPSGAVFDAGTQAPVTVDARLRDGGLFAVTIPLTSSFGTNTTRTSGVGAPLGLPTTAGRHTLSAGWMGGPDASVEIFTAACQRTCQPWEACRPTTDGGVCESLQLTLSWLSPDAGTPFNASFQARLSVTSARGPVPTSLSAIPVFGQTADFQGEGFVANLTGGPPTYAGSLPLFAQDQPKRFIAGWPDGGPIATLQVERDTTPPVVALRLVGPPGTNRDPVDPVWKKNETALVEVYVDQGLPPGATNLSVVDSGVAVASGSGCLCTSFPEPCTCWAVPLLDAAEFPLMTSWRGDSAILRATGITDRAGNVAPPSELPIAVSRHLWTQTLMGGSPFTSLAVAENGLVVVANGNDVVAVRSDGGIEWTWSTPGGYAITSGPVLSATQAFVTIFSNPTSSLRRISLATGLETATLCESTDQDRFSGPLVLARTPTGVDLPVSFRKQSFVAGAGNCPSTDVGISSAPLTLSTSTTNTGDTLIAASFPGQGNHQFTFDGVDFTSGGSFGQASAFSFFASGLVGFSTPGRPGTSSLETPLTPATRTTASAGGRPLATSATVLFIDPLLSACPYTSSGFAPACAPWSPLGFSRTPTDAALGSRAPVILDQYNGSGLIEAFSDGGVTFIPTPFDPVAMALDVARTPTGAKACSARFGRAYVLENFRLSAYLTDAKGLDQSASWARPRHDNANSGSELRPLTPWSCP